MSRRLRRSFVVVGLVACLAAVWGCHHQDRVRILETQKAMLLDNTQPKQAFWDQVGRKGTALREERAAAAELASVQQQIAATRTSLDQAHEQLEAARATNAKAADVLSGQLAQLDKAQGEVGADRAVLAGFQARQRKPGGS